MAGQARHRPFRYRLDAAGPDSDVNLLVHKACLDLDITHIESLCNLEALLGKGQFTFIGLPMEWREGTASPIRAVAVFDM
jgi:kynurenine formamidase